jgi:hypothetical protein
MNDSNMVVVSFISTIQPLEAAVLVEMNIDHRIAVQQSKCCDAAKRLSHGYGKK